MEARIAVLPGDGIGPEVMDEALRVLDRIGSKFGHNFILEKGLVGGAAFERFENHFPEQTKKLCERSEAILLGSVGGPVSEANLLKWRNCEINSILAIRKIFEFNANFRPARVYPQLRDICPLKYDIVDKGVDLLVIRELIGDIYFGEKRRFERGGRRVATDLAQYSEDQISAIAEQAFKAAKVRRGKVTSVDKANVLNTSKLWREVVHEVHQQYTEVVLEDMLVDNCAMQIIRNPSQFDVIVTSNMFGDILSDAASVIPGSLGLSPSASLNAEGFGLYEPSGGSAPDIAGKGIANPIAQILSAAMMLKYTFSLLEEAQCIEMAVEKALDEGHRTADIAKQGCVALTTREFADQVLKNI